LARPLKLSKKFSTKAGARSSGLSVSEKASSVRTSVGPPPSAKTGVTKASVAPVEKDMSGYVSTHMVNTLNTSGSEEEASPLRRRRRRTNKSLLQETSVEPPKVVDAPMIEGLNL
jgi:hypothetical protein